MILVAMLVLMVILDMTHLYQILLNVKVFIEFRLIFLCDLLKIMKIIFILACECTFPGNYSVDNKCDADGICACNVGYYGDKCENGTKFIVKF